MPGIRPFAGYRVTAKAAERIVAPAYDAVSVAERRAFADAHPDNFINTMRLREDFPSSAVPDTANLLADNRANFERLLGGGAFERVETPSIYVYQLQENGHRQTGLVCEISIDEYTRGQLRRHENTRTEQEMLLAEYQSVVGVSANPVGLAYPWDAAIEEALEAHTDARPLLDFSVPAGPRQRVWAIEDRISQRALSDAFARLPVTYLTDGHHRVAAAERYAGAHRAEHGDSPDAPHNRLLVALFSDRSLRLLPFHRCVRETGARSPEALREALERCGKLREADVAAACPRSHRQFGVLFGGRWHTLELPEPEAGAAAVDQLDVSLLQRQVLDPVFGITDYRSDSRLGYVSGAFDKSKDAQALEARQADGWICFACHPVSMQQLMAVADAGQLMPPKSTYFAPKPSPGIFISPRTAAAEPPNE